MEAYEREAKAAVPPPPAVPKAKRGRASPSEPVEIAMSLFDAPPPVEAAARNAPFGLSVSALVSFARCPRQFHWSAVRPLPRRASAAAALGTAVHRWIETRHGPQGVLVDTEGPPGVGARAARFVQRVAVRGDGAGERRGAIRPVRRWPHCARPYRRRLRTRRGLDRARRLQDGPPAGRRRSFGRDTTVDLRGRGGRQLPVRRPSASAPASSTSRATVRSRETSPSTSRPSASSRRGRGWRKRRAASTRAHRKQTPALGARVATSPRGARPRRLRVDGVQRGVAVAEVQTEALRRGDHAHVVVLIDRQDVVDLIVGAGRVVVEQHNLRGAGAHA